MPWLWNIPMGKALLAILCLIALAAVARAQGSGPEPSAATRRICASVAAAAPPAADLPTAAQAAALAGCDAEALYYGIGRPADPAQARLCAFAQRGTKADDDTRLLGQRDADDDLRQRHRRAAGSAPRDALRPAGSMAPLPSWRGASPTSRRRRRRTGAGTISPGAKTSPADLPAVSAPPMTSGSRRRSGKACSMPMPPGCTAPRRRGSRNCAARRPPGRGRAGGNEIDLSGTLRGAFVTQEEELQDRDFRDMIERLRAGRPPPLGAAQLRAATARMNTVLARIAAAGPAQMANWGTVTKQGIAEHADGVGRVSQRLGRVRGRRLSGLGIGGGGGVGDDEARRHAGGVPQAVGGPRRIGLSSIRRGA